MNGLGQVEELLMDLELLVFYLGQVHQVINKELNHLERVFLLVGYLQVFKDQSIHFALKMMVHYNQTSFGFHQVCKAGLLLEYLSLKLVQQQSYLVHFLLKPFFYLVSDVSVVVIRDLVLFWIINILRKIPTQQVHLLLNQLLW